MYNLTFVEFLLYVITLPYGLGGVLIAHAAIILTFVGITAYRGIREKSWLLLGSSASALLCGIGLVHQFMQGLDASFYGLVATVAFLLLALMLMRRHYKLSMQQLSLALS